MGATIPIGCLTAKDCQMPENANEIAPEALAALAEERGLRQLLELDPEGFEAAVVGAAGLSERTARPERLDTEPAHTCRFPNRATEA